MTNRRPAIGARIVRGLREMASLVSAEVDGAGWLYDEPDALDDVHAALRYVYALCDWYARKNGGNEDE